jgi:hypothetical protein
VDRTFGASGFVGGALSWIPSGVAAASDGSLVVSDFSNDGTIPPVECVERYAPNGVLDPSFGTAGVVRFGTDPAPHAQAVGILRAALWKSLGRRSWPTGSSNGVQGAVNLDVLGTVLAGTVDTQERLVILGLTDDTQTAQWFVRRYRL